MSKNERSLSATAMVAGFVVDQTFFRRIDLWQTQMVFASYVATCFISIPLLHWIEARAERGIPAPRWRPLIPLVTQFSLGGFWSGFLFFYGRSAVLGASWPFLLLLVLQRFAAIVHCPVGYFRFTWPRGRAKGSGGVPGDAGRGDG